MSSAIPQSLRIWFIIHFVADMIFAIPLLFTPVLVLSFFDFSTAETFFARLVGAALIGIGGTSLVMHKGTPESFKTMLTLKLLWSSSALVGIILSIIQGGPVALWFFFAIFLAFNGVWSFYTIKLRE